MRIVLVGATPMSVEAARRFVDQGDQVILIDPDRKRFDDLAGDLDIAFIEGDGARPEVLKEANPSDVDLLYALADDDKVNIIAALVGRAGGIKRVIPKIEDREYHPIAKEIGLDERVDPDHFIAKSLVRLGKEGDDGLEADAEEEARESDD